MCHGYPYARRTFARFLLSPPLPPPFPHVHLITLKIMLYDIAKTKGLSRGYASVTEKWRSALLQVAFIFLLSAEPPRYAMARPRRPTSQRRAGFQHVLQRLWRTRTIARFHIRTSGGKARAALHAADQTPPPVY